MTTKLPKPRGAMPPATTARAQPPATRQRPMPMRLATPVAMGREWSTRGPVRLGFAALIVLLLGLGGWSATARIAGAVIASGMIQVEGNRQAIQHPDGGIVGEIKVRDGDIVEAGDVLIRFDETIMRSELAIIEGQLNEILARKGRLIAERDGADTITFSDELLEIAAQRPEIENLMQGQRSLFRARIDTLTQETGQLRERQQQITEQVQGMTAQIAALEEQRDLIDEELTDQQTLLDRGLTQQSRVLALRRERARLGGQLGELMARVAESRARASETEIEILRLTSARREDAITTLRDLDYTEIELRERRLAAQARMQRLDIRTPVTGTVYASNVNTVGAVLRPAEILMYIVPQEQPLVITARIETIHIDEISVGQAAGLRFPAFDQRTTPEIEGTVTKISADAFTDEATGLAYYSAELLPLDGELDKIQNAQIVPGMPVEAYIRTGERTPLNYLVKPLADYFNRAFREN